MAGFVHPHHRRADFINSFIEPGLDYDYTARMEALAVANEYDAFKASQKRSWPRLGEHVIRSFMEHDGIVLENPRAMKRPIEMFYTSISSDMAYASVAILAAMGRDIGLYMELFEYLSDKPEHGLIVVTDLGRTNTTSVDVPENGYIWGGLLRGDCYYARGGLYHPKSRDNFSKVMQTMTGKEVGSINYLTYD